jgi:thiamine-monophosphate kinase
MAGHAGDIGEFELIADYFAPLGANSRTAAVDRITLGIGDDAALLNPAPGQQLAISVDTLAAGVHFPVDGPARLIAHKVLRTNLSDLAAMGATPLAYTLALTLPAADKSWLAEFSGGLKEVADEFPIALIGGDTTRGSQLVITVQIFGEVPSGQALLRSGAQVGDTIFVTGTLGDARAALDILNLPSHELDDAQQFLLDRYYKPTPRIAFAQALHGIATAAIDVSDGLAADLGHILKASGVGAEIQLTKLPLSNAIPIANAQRYALSGGDDYEICFTAPPEQEERIRELAERSSTRVTAIGRIARQRGLTVVDSDGVSKPLTHAAGYTHF